MRASYAISVHIASAIVMTYPSHARAVEYPYLHPLPPLWYSFLVLLPFRAYAQLLEMNVE